MNSEAGAIQAAAPAAAPPEGTAVDRLLRVFGDVRAGEGGSVLLVILDRSLAARERSRITSSHRDITDR